MAFRRARELNIPSIAKLGWNGLGVCGALSALSLPGCAGESRRNLYRVVAEVRDNQVLSFYHRLLQVLFSRATNHQALVRISVGLIHRSIIQQRHVYNLLDIGCDLGSPRGTSVKAYIKRTGGSM